METVGSVAVKRTARQGVEDDLRAPLVPIALEAADMDKPGPAWKII